MLSLTTPLNSHGLVPEFRFSLMPVMTSRLVLSLKEVADRTAHRNERSFTTMAFSARFSSQELEPEFGPPACVDGRALPLRARHRLTEPDPEAE